MHQLQVLLIYQNSKGHSNSLRLVAQSIPLLLVDLVAQRIILMTIPLEAQVEAALVNYNFFCNCFFTIFNCLN